VCVCRAFWRKAQLLLPRIKCLRACRIFYSLFCFFVWPVSLFACIMSFLHFGIERLCLFVATMKLIEKKEQKQLEGNLFVARESTENYRKPQMTSNSTVTLYILCRQFRAISNQSNDAKDNSTNASKFLSLNYLSMVQSSRSKCSELIFRVNLP